MAGMVKDKAAVVKYVGDCYTLFASKVAGLKAALAASEDKTTADEFDLNAVLSSAESLVTTLQKNLQQAKTQKVAFEPASV